MVALVLTAATLHAERWRFNYGRKLTPLRIPQFALPRSETLNDWVAGKIVATMGVIAASLAPYQEGEVPESKFNRAAFAETERDPVTVADVESVMREVMDHPAKPESKSENREPTKDEISQRWKLARDA